RLKYHDGCCGAPPFDATTAYTPSCSTRMSAFLRSLPLRAPTEVSTMMGLPRNSFASAPPEASKVSACVRAHSEVLGAYSPVNGILLLPVSRLAALTPASHIENAGVPTVVSRTSGPLAPDTPEFSCIFDMTSTEAEAEAVTRRDDPVTTTRDARARFPRDRRRCAEPRRRRPPRP